MKRVPRTMTRLAAVAAVVAWLVAGCASGPGGAGERVTLRDLERDPASTPPDDPEGEAIPSPEPTAAVFMQRLTLPLERSLDDAWAMLDPAPAPPLSRGVWQSNGIRLGVLPRDQWPAFVEALPRRLAVRQTRLLATDQPLAIVSSHRLNRPIRVDLTIPPMRPRETWAKRGRLRLLAEVSEPRPSSTGGTTGDDAATRRRVALIPHHQVPRTLVLPNELAEDRLPGVVFEQLALRFDLPADRLLVIALDRPWDRVPEPTQPEASPDDSEAEPAAPLASAAPDQAAVEAEAEAEADPPEDAESDSDSDPDSDSEPDSADPPAEVDPTPDRSGPPIPDVPPHLGRALLTAERLNRPVQRVVVISVLPLNEQ